MSELTNRDDLEADFALKLSRLTTKQRKEFELLLGDPPDPANVPQEFWDRVQQELDDNMTILLLLIASASYTQHGGALVQPSAPTFDQALAKLLGKESQPEPPSPLVQWARDISGKTAAGFVDRSKDMLATAGDEWAQAIADGEDISGRDIIDKALQIFGPERAARIAVNETTRAQHQGSEYAIATTVGLSEDDLWINRPLLSRTGPCPVCEPLHMTPRSYWGRFFPQGPPTPHVGCVCYVQFANEPAEVVAQ